MRDLQPKMNKDSFELETVVDFMTKIDRVGSLFPIHIAIHSGNMDALRKQ